MRNKKLAKKILSLALSAGIFMTSFSLVGCVSDNTDAGATVASQWITGTDAPTAVANVNDMYLDTTTFDVYKYTENGWEKLGNIKGAVGEKGETGVAGSAGGPQGPQGEQGETGPIGPQGPAVEIESFEVDVDGYIIINGEKTDSRLYEKIDATTLAGNFTALQGSFETLDSLTKSRVVITKRVKRGTVITYKGSSDYEIGVIQADATEKFASTWFHDSGWLSANTQYKITNAVSEYVYVILNYHLTTNENITAEKAQELLSQTTFDGIFESDFLKLTQSEANMNYDNVMRAVAHRGFSKGAPENTLAAFRLAKEKGFNYVECDVNLASDGVPVVLHGPAYHGYENSQYVTGNISDVTSTYLTSLNADINSTYPEEKIALFADFLTLCKELGLHPYIEIKEVEEWKGDGSKHQDKVNMGKQIAQMVVNAGLGGKVSYICFDSSYLGGTHEVDVNSRTGVLTGADISEDLASNMSVWFGSNVFISANVGLTATSIQNCKNNNLDVEVWTVDDRNTILNLDPYISGVTSNFLHAGKIIYNKNQVL